MRTDSPRLFLCHATEDKGVVRKLHARLLMDGLSPWLDEIDLLPGQDWQREIDKAIRSADVFLACISENSINKRGYVQRELKRALHVLEEIPESAIYLIPVRLSDCQIPERLAQKQWMDLFPDFECGYSRLLRAMNTYFQFASERGESDSSLHKSIKRMWATRVEDDSTIPLSIPLERLQFITSIAHSLWGDFAEFAAKKDISKDFRNEYRSGRRGGLILEFARFVSDIFATDDGIEVILLNYDLTKIRQTDSDDFTSALVVTTDSSGYRCVSILIDYNEIDVRKRNPDFALHQIIHQLGHIVLHEKSLGNNWFQETTQTQRAEASWFATQLLALNGI